jgi:MEMO1 family protein
MRQSIVDGQFYESDEQALKQQIENCFKTNLGPGFLIDKERKKDNEIGLICPHAGYIFSGPCQAYSFKKIAESKIPDLYIMLGLSHSGFNSCISTQDWQTPLGIVDVDKKFGEELSKMSNVAIDEIPHQNEHSIEVQLPFLQYINLNQKFKILPIIIAPDINIKQFCIDIKKILDLNKKTCTFIASSDFTHYGNNYSFVPFSKNIKENLYKLDKGAIEYILKLDSNGFNEYIEKTGATICGRYPIIALIEILKLFGIKKGELLKYYTSADIVNDYSNAVGYASIKF